MTAEIKKRIAGASLAALLITGVAGCSHEEPKPTPVGVIGTSGAPGPSPAPGQLGGAPGLSGMSGAPGPSAPH